MRLAKEPEVVFNIDVLLTDIKNTFGSQEAKSKKTQSLKDKDKDKDKDQKKKRGHSYGKESGSSNKGSFGKPNIEGSSYQGSSHVTVKVGGPLAMASVTRQAYGRQATDMDSAQGYSYQYVADEGFSLIASKDTKEVILTLNPKS